VLTHRQRSKEGDGLINGLKERGLEVSTYLVGRKAVNYYKFRNRKINRIMDWVLG